MALPRIVNPVPVPLRKETLVDQYADLYLIDFRALATQPGERRAVEATLLPYDQATDTLMPGGEPIHLAVPDLDAEAAAYPLVAQTMGLLLHATSLLIQRDHWRREIERWVVAAIEDEGARQAMDAARASLAQVEAALQGGGG